MKCPVCDINTFNDYDYEHNICKECFWEYDPVQVDDPDFYVGANDLSLNEYKKVYNELKRQNSKFSCKNEKDLKLMLELTNIY
jgi:hypothetical protein